jgi:hypothetical protein
MFTFIYCAVQCLPISGQELSIGFNFQASGRRLNERFVLPLENGSH